MLILILIIAVILAFVAVLLINTAVKKAAARKLVGDHPTFTEGELAE